jgi:hypothetical protein
MSGQMPMRLHITMRTQNVFGMAHDYAARLGYTEPTPLHVLLAIVREGRSPAVAVLSSCVRLDERERELDQRLAQVGVARVANFSWSASDERILQRGARLRVMQDGCTPYRRGIRDDESAEVPLALEHSVQQDVVLCRRQAVNRVVCCHDRPRAGAQETGIGFSFMSAESRGALEVALIIMHLTRS